VASPRDIDEAPGLSQAGSPRGELGQVVDVFGGIDRPDRGQAELAHTYFCVNAAFLFPGRPRYLATAVGGGQ
jgi:hypothetical protein